MGMSGDADRIPEAVIAVVTDLLGVVPRTWEVREGGHTRTGKALVTLPDRARVFVKWATPGTGAAAALRDELRVLSVVRGTFLPQTVAWSEDPPILIMEDLSEARWPPPYPTDAGPLWVALDAKARVEPPTGLPLLEEWPGPPQRWRHVAADPRPFLGLGLVTAAWLTHALDDLVRAEESVTLAGSQLVHNDLSSANIAFRGDRAVLVDWATAAVGNASLDAAMIVLSLRAEGSASDHPAFPDEAGFAALLAGHNALEVPAPLPSWARSDSTMRSEQLADLRHALAWVAELLGLPVPDGPSALDGA